MTNPMLGPTSDDKLWAGLSYAGTVLCAVPTIVIYLLKKDESDYIHFHSLQALALALFNLVIMMSMMVLSAIPFVGFVVGLVGFGISMGMLGIWIFLMVKAFMGEGYEVPVLADYLRQQFMKGS